MAARAGRAVILFAAFLSSAAAFLRLPARYTPQHHRSIRSPAYSQQRPLECAASSSRAARWSKLYLQMVGSAGLGGGDLAGGSDSERNAQLSSLKKMFYSEPEEQGGPIHDTGLILDMPLCRWSWVLLPGQQLTLNVWQPQYTLMFEKILASPGPHYYFHVLLPGGAESLGKQEYELKPGSKAPLAGTLVKIVLAQREADSRLSLVVQVAVQCLARATVLWYSVAFLRKSLMVCALHLCAGSGARRRAERDAGLNLNVRPHL